MLNLDGDVYEVRLSGDELEFRHLITVKDIQFITCIRYYPKQGLLIIGSNTEGLFLFKKQQLVSVGKNYANPDAFYALAPYSDDRVLTTNGLLPHGRPELGTTDALNRYSILRDRNRHYWYARMLSLLETDERFRVLKTIQLTQWLACVQEDERGTICLARGTVILDGYKRIHSYLISWKV